MSFIKLSPTKIKHEKIGNVDSICPHCAKPLEKRPGRKAKCVFCGNYIFVRTRPADMQKVLVTEAQATQIDIQWMKENGTYDDFLAEQAKVQNTKKRLSQRFGKVASDRDVQWAIFNERLIKYSKRGDWGLFRNTRFEMAELLRKEGQYSEALVIYIEVSYLDANGPQNIGGVTSSYLLNEYPPFDPTDGIQAPAIVRWIKKLSETLKLDEQSLQDKFIKVATEVQTRLNLQIAPIKAWHEYLMALDA